MFPQEMGAHRHFPQNGRCVDALKLVNVAMGMFQTTSGSRHTHTHVSTQHRQNDTQHNETMITNCLKSDPARQLKIQLVLSY